MSGLYYPGSFDRRALPDPEPLTFEELVWACDTCGWAVSLCTEHRAMAEEIRAEQDADHYRDES